jgi:hypothetical protein
MRFKTILTLVAFLQHVTSRRFLECCVQWISMFFAMQSTVNCQPQYQRSPVEQKQKQADAKFVQENMPTKIQVAPVEHNISPPPVKENVPTKIQVAPVEHISPPSVKENMPTKIQVAPVEHNISPPSVKENMKNDFRREVSTSSPESFHTESKIQQLSEQQMLDKRKTDEETQRLLEEFSANVNGAVIQELVLLFICSKTMFMLRHRF